MALELATELQRLPGSSDPESDPVDDDALVLLESRWRNAHPVPELVLEATACMADASKSVPVRARAGVLGLIFADNMCDAPSAKRIYSTLVTLPGVDTERSVLAEAEVIFHCTFGNLQQSLSAARNLIEMQRSSPRPILLCRALRYAATVSVRSGRFSEADMLAGEALRIAQQYQLSSAAVGATILLSTIRLTEGDLLASRDLCQEALAYSIAVQDSVASTLTKNLGVRIDIAQGRWDTAASVVAELRDDAFKNQSVRARTSATAIALTIQMLKQDLELDDSLFDTLRPLHETMRRFGGHDFNALAFYHSLRYVGRHTEAEAHLRAYAACRREVYGLPTHLIALPQHGR